MPKRNACLATTIVFVTAGFAVDSIVFARWFAWLFSQTLAMNTASRPKTTANPIMTNVLARTALFRLTYAPDPCADDREQEVCNY